MIISRWQAEANPDQTILTQILLSEGLDTMRETFPAQKKISEHRHPFTEVRYIISGELLFNISGNQFLLRAGDRVEIPANTKHSYTNNANQECVSICGYRAI